MNCLAGLLTPPPHSAGLLAVLADEVAALRDTIEAEAAWPTRGKQRDQFARLGALAEELAALLREPAVAVRMIYAPERDAARAAVLDAVPLLAAAARDEVAAIRSGPGRDLGFPAPDGLTALGMCAWHAARLWWGTHGAAPGPYTPGVRALCGGLWAASGGAAERGYQGGATGWPAHLKAVLPRLHRRDADELAATIRARDLIEGK